MASHTYTLRDAVENDLTHYWTSKGYALVSNDDGSQSLVREGVEGQVVRKYVALTPKTKIHVQKSGNRARAALVKQFGFRSVVGFSEAYPNASHILIRGGQAVPIVRSDKRVELTPYGIEPGENIFIQLITTQETRLPGIPDHIIPVVKLSFSVYVRGIYKDKKTSAITRQIDIAGTKDITMGSALPRGEDAKFWDDLYKELLDNVVDEFRVALTKHPDYAFSSENLEDGNWDSWDAYGIDQEDLG